jgi:hypothetical protein
MSAYSCTSWPFSSEAWTETVSRVRGADSRLRSPGSIEDSHSAVSSTPVAVSVKIERVAVTASNVWVAARAPAAGLPAHH